MTPEDFYKALKELGFDLSQKQKDQFQQGKKQKMGSPTALTIIQSG